MTRLASVVLVGFALVACGSSGTKPTPVETRQLTAEDNLPQRQTTNRSNEGREGANLRTVYFDYDEARLRPDAKESLRQNAEYLRSLPSAVVELQGNCDERGTEEYNLALGKRRAESAKQYLADLGIPDGRLTTVSFGEENPAVSGSGESVWSRNRRVDFVLR